MQLIVYSMNDIKFQISMAFPPFKEAGRGNAMPSRMWRANRLPFYGSTWSF